MKKRMIWKIWGNGLPVLYIPADSFDEALKEARKNHPNYTAGQVQEKCNEYDDARR